MLYLERIETEKHGIEELYGMWVVVQIENICYPNSMRFEKQEHI